MFIFLPTCLKCSCLSVVVHKSCGIASLRGSGRAAKSSTQRGVHMCVCVWVDMCKGFVWAAWCNFLNPALVVLEKAHLALKAYPRSGQKSLLQNTSPQTLMAFFFGKSAAAKKREKTKNKKKPNHLLLDWPLYIFAFLCMLSVLSL